MVREVHEGSGVRVFIGAGRTGTHGPEYMPIPASGKECGRSAGATRSLQTVQAQRATLLIWGDSGSQKSLLREEQVPLGGDFVWGRGLYAWQALLRPQGLKQHFLWNLIQHKVVLSRCLLREVRNESTGWGLLEPSLGLPLHQVQPGKNPTTSRSPALVASAGW